MGQGYSKEISQEEVEEYKIQFRKHIHDHYETLLSECKKQIEYEQMEYKKLIQNYKYPVII